MKTPHMHCTNPDCVEDNCRGECLTLTDPTATPEANSSSPPEKIESLQWNSWSYSNSAIQPYCEDS